MATRVSVFFLYSFLLLATIAFASIEEVCRKISTVDEHVNYDFCVKSLHAAPGGPSADERGLAAIAGNLASQHAQATLPKIHELVRSASQSEKGPLLDCQELYGGAVEDLKTAAAYAKDNRYSDANVYFSAGIDAATTCEDGFSERKVQSPLTEEDDKLFQLSAIGASITYTGP